MNKCTFIGRLSRDAEIKYLQDGTAVCNFSIAVSEKYKNKSGERIEKTEWVTLVAFGKLAEICTEWLKKGSLIYVCGKLQTQSWEKDGVKHYKTVINISEMEMLGGKNASESTQGQKADNLPDPDVDVPF